MVNKSHDNFTFLSEQPLNSTDSLEFGHKDIVSTLVKIVINSPKSFTIGIFGDWGSGKSTIAHSLKKNLENEKIPVIIFDVWKHEGDSLRRTFLNSLVNKLKSEYDDTVFNHKYELDKRISNINTINEEHQYVNWKKIIPHIIVLALISASLLLPFFITYCIIYLITDLIDINQTLKTLIIGISSTISFTLFFKYINHFIEVKKVTTTIDKFKDPEEFENEFKRIIEDGFLQSKMAIVFDNLDRVNGDKALEIMAAIKTFLDPMDMNLNREIIFIIPCDEKAIKRHIQKALGFTDDLLDNERYTSEYLRKFFNTVLWIPEFYTNELEKLALDNLKGTKISDLNNDEVAALIVLVFDKNPRQIIQFINILVANYLLIMESNMENFNLSKNIPQLAKYLILNQQFPDIMDYLKKNSIYSLEKSEIYTIPDADIKKNEFNEFLEITNHIIIPSLDIYFKLRKSKFDKEFENCDRLLRMLETQEIRNIVLYQEHDPNKINLIKLKNSSDIEYLKGLNFNEKHAAFNQVIKEKLIKSTNPVLIVKLIDSLFYLIRYYEISLTNSTYNIVISKLTISKHLIYRINIQNIVTEGIYKILDPTLSKKLFEIAKEQWFKDFTSENKIIDQKFPDEYSKNILNIVLENHKLFENENFEKIQTTIERNHYNDFSLFINISNNDKMRDKLSSNQFLINVIKTIGYESNTDDINYIKLLNHIVLYDKKHFTKELVDEIIELIISSIKNINSSNNHKKELLNSNYSILEFLKPYLNGLHEVKIILLYNNISESFNLESIKGLKDVFKFILFFHYNTNYPNISYNIKSNISNFLSLTDVNSLIKEFENFYNINDFLKIDFVQEIIIRRSSDEKDFLNLFFPLFSAENQLKVLSIWVQNEPNELLNYLQNIEFQIKDKNSFGGFILTLTGSNKSIEKNKILYLILNNLNITGKFELEKYSNQIIDLIISHLTTEQELGIQQHKINPKLISVYNLQLKCQQALNNNFENLTLYVENIKNILKMNFGGKKKYLNETFEQNSNIKSIIANFLISTSDIEFLTILRNLLYKKNYLEVCREVLIVLSTISNGNENQLKDLTQLLNFILNKYSSDLKPELSLLMHNNLINYRAKNSSLIIKIETILNN